MKRVTGLLKAFLLAALVAGAVVWQSFEELFLRLNEPSIRRALTVEFGEERAGRIIEELGAIFRRESDSWPETDRGVFRYHRANLTLGLSLYKAMREVLGEKKDLVGDVHRMVWDAGPRKVFRPAGFVLGLFKDQHRVFARAAEMVNRYMFPVPPYRRSYVEVEGGMGFDYTKCFYYDFLSERGVPELTRAYCDMDNRMMELMPDSIEFRREHFIGKGDDRCDFRYFWR